jgi:hypothetical protein
MKGRIEAETPLSQREAIVAPGDGCTDDLLRGHNYSEMVKLT